MKSKKFERALKQTKMVVDGFLEQESASRDALEALEAFSAQDELDEFLKNNASNTYDGLKERTTVTPPFFYMMSLNMTKDDLLGAFARNNKVIQGWGKKISDLLASDISCEREEEHYLDIFQFYLACSNDIERYFNTIPKANGLTTDRYKALLETISDKMSEAYPAQVVQNIKMVAVMNARLEKNVGSLLFSFDGEDDNNRRGTTPNNAKPHKRAKYKHG